MPAKETHLQKAQRLFGLHRPTTATEERWEAYTTSRLACVATPGQSLFKKEKTENIAEGDENDQEDKDEDEDEGEDEDEYDDEGGDKTIKRHMRSFLTDIERELAFPNGTLAKGAMLLSLDATFEDEEEPRTVDTLSRIYSPTTPTSIDVHFFYHSRSRAFSCEWMYSIGYHINNYSSPSSSQDTTSQYISSTNKSLRNKKVNTMHSKNGWKTVSWGYLETVPVQTQRRTKRRSFRDFDDDENGPRTADVEKKAFCMKKSDVEALHNAFWGPNPGGEEGDGENSNLAQSGSSDDIERTTKSKRKGTTPEKKEDDPILKELLRRGALLRSIRVLLAAVGVSYVIAVDDEEKDESSSGWRHRLETGDCAIRWCLEQSSGSFARAARKACGFRLTKDPEADEQEKREMEEELKGGRYDDYDDEDSDDDEGEYSDEDDYF